MKEIILDRIDHVFSFSAKELIRVVNDLKVPIFNLAILLSQTKGHIVVTGCGKSGIIARKFVATLNSIGVPSIFLHASDARHGDLGVIRNEDQLVVLSKSGNTKDIVFLASALKSKNMDVFGIVNNKEADVLSFTSEAIIIDAYKESDKYDIIPTTSIVLQLAVCDALALAIQELKSLDYEDFSNNHPSGTLGNLTNNKIDDLFSFDQSIYVLKDDPVNKAIISSSKGRKGATVVLGANVVIGIITDGDIRRMLESNKTIHTLKCEDIMNKNPIIIKHDELGSTALNKMNEFKISQLVVIKDGGFRGLIHLHDLLNNS